MVLTDSPIRSGRNPSSASLSAAERHRPAPSNDCCRTVTRARAFGSRRARCARRAFTLRSPAAAPPARVLAPRAKGNRLRSGWAVPRTWPRRCAPGPLLVVVAHAPVAGAATRRAPRVVAARARVSMRRVPALVLTTSRTPSPSSSSSARWVPRVPPRSWGRRLRALRRPVSWSSVAPVLRQSPAAPLRSARATPPLCANVT